MFIKSFFSIFTFIASISLSLNALAWNYKNKTDPMNNSAYAVASLRSKNSLNLSFPYSGKNHGYINFIAPENQNNLVIVGVDKGQILCNEPCMFGFRFDNSDTIFLYAKRASDGSSNYVVLERPDLFLDWAKDAKKIRVQLDFYQGGSPVLDFTTNKPLNLTKK
jgi:hypothetical protein